MKGAIIRFINTGYTLLILIAVVFLTLSLPFLWGPLKAVIVLFILFFLGLLVVQDLIVFSKSTIEWERTETLDNIEHMLMPSVQVFVKGAIEGSEYSRERVHDDIRRWFFSRVETERGTDNKKLDDIKDDTAALEQFLGDKMIAEFIVHGYEGPSFDKNKANKFLFENTGRRDKGYEKWLKELLKRMEEWE
ncbi:MAG: hypothetical protein R6U17_08285 [Thermoplasmata archaeon]